MVIVFDTSTLVAAHAQPHPQFAWADQQAQAAARPAVCAHSLAELYAVMTAHPQLRSAPVQVQGVIERIHETWEVLPLAAADDLAAIQRCQQLNLQGGAIDDTLIAQATLRVQARGLVTLNARHFVRLGKDVAQLVIQPDWN